MNYIEELTKLLQDEHAAGTYSSRNFQGEAHKILKKAAAAPEQSSGFFTPLVEAAQAYMGEYYGDVMMYIIRHAAEYPYSTGYYRRPFRSDKLTNHTGTIIYKWFQLAALWRENFSVLDYLIIPGKDTHSYTVSDLLAYELDRNNDFVLQALRGVVYGDNNTALLSRIMLNGMIMSHRDEAHTMLGELLIAARLQEGLRQSIVETMDEGTLAGMMHLLQIIVDEGYIRYSSVVRALGVWTGLSLEAAQTRVTKQCLEYGYLCLRDAQVREEWSTSEDVNKLYMSLWATAVLREEDADEKVRSLMKHGALYQQTTAMHFLSQSQNKELRYSIAADYLDARDPELQSLVLSCYDYSYSITWNYGGGTNEELAIERIPQLEQEEERSRQFDLLRALLLELPKTDRVVPSRVFDWLQMGLTRDTVMNKLIYLTAYDYDPSRIASLIELKEEVSPDIRSILLRFLAKDAADSVQRTFLFDSLTDKSMAIRSAAMKIVRKLELSSEEVLRVEELLQLKSGGIRQQAVQVLLALPDEPLQQSVQRLLHSRSELQRLGGLELLCERKEQDPDTLNEEERLVLSWPSPTAKERILIERMQSKEEYGAANGFGLFDPSRDHMELALPAYEKGQARAMFNLEPARIVAFMRGLSQLIHEHREHEYEVEYYNGEKSTRLLGDELMRASYDPEAQHPLEALPLTEVWQRYLEESGWGTADLLQAAYYYSTSELHCRFVKGELRQWEKSEYDAMEERDLELLAELYPLEHVVELHEELRAIPYPEQMNHILNAYLFGSPRQEQFECYHRILAEIAGRLPAELPEDKQPMLYLFVNSWSHWLRQRIYDDASFCRYFPLQYSLYVKTYYRQFEPGLDEFIRAYDLELVDADELYRELLLRNRKGRHMQIMTDRRKERNFTEEHPSIRPFRDAILARILEMEMGRGDLPTEVSSLVTSIRSYEGMQYFIQILSRLEKEAFVRGYIYSSQGVTKKEAFSHLLSACHPRDGEGVETLREMLVGTKISETRLLEAAMYAPQWLELIAAYLGWDGLRSAAWYFHAHVNERFSEEKETIVAHYSPISPADFNEGAFDIIWFREAYEELGDERFTILYDCAKYISAGANHRRAQLFADSVLGRLDLEETRHKVEAKRNKDLLLAYSLIPLRQEREQDILQRYEYIQQFLKESKSFGAQRRASEGRIAAIALDNLARNSGYADVTRLKWDMEAQKVQSMSQEFEPQAIDDFTVRIVISDKGDASLEVQRGGKELKSIPAKYNKHEQVVYLKERVSELRTQYKRAREELERAMESGVTFTPEELRRLRGNPVLKPLLEMLVFHNGKGLGFLGEGELKDTEGGAIPLEPDDEVILAHPVHLYESGQWSSFQRHLFDRQLKQPFKQVFRELYRPLEDELNSGSVSRRYAGHQIQPKKAAALLRSRMWTANYGEGLQKVYYKENLIARVDALADWFSPSEIEYPTLESVRFHNRKTYEAVPISEIPKPIFSEVMRDVDLVVSVAHAGSVDPEASLTTMELRRVIVEESLRLLKITNVRLSGSFALITGSLGEYSVHLGSGMVYKQAAGALHIIPVQAQHRGRIFLPFMDEDPKTAEILSKITMLSQDTKIKDPLILGQLTG